MQRMPKRASPIRPTRSVRRPVLPATADRHVALIARALAHVDAHLAEPLDADRLADCAAMSRHHFHRAFRAHIGCSVGEWVTWRRLQRAGAMLVSGREAVQVIAAAVGYESAQALNKALRRELGTTPTALRRGDAAPWSRLLRPLPDALLPTPHAPGAFDMTPTRYADVPAGLVALTATARGMVQGTMTRAARQAFGELGQAVGAAGLMPQVASWMCLVPDDAQGPDDPDCRYVAALVFGHQLHTGQGRCVQPELPLSGSLAWQPIAPGRCAVFTHIGPYADLHRVWAAIYRDWLPASGEQLRDAPPMELCLNSPQLTPPELLHTEIWVPLAPHA
jgi:AraC family transcriptional regulator